MHSQEIEANLRERILLTVLIWQDDAYGLIRWKMDFEFGHDVATGFANPDFAAYANSFGACDYRINSASDLLPTLTETLAADTVSVITCLVDYSENLQLTDALGELTRLF
jgi:acetolactate synthase I/II/III large subunit